MNKSIVLCAVLLLLTLTECSVSDRQEQGWLTDTHKDIRVSRAVYVQFSNNQQ